MRPRLAWRRCAAVALVGGVCLTAATARPAQAFNPLKTGCEIGGIVAKQVRAACAAVSVGGKAVGAAKQLFGGHVGGALKALLGGGSSVAASTATTALGLAAVGVWVLGGAKFALDETAKVLSQTTSPQLTSSWFSATYWRVAGIAFVLTLPFLFAAAVQAVVRSDLALLLRAAFGYLPLAMLVVAIAAPLTMLMLAASDQLAGVVSAAAGNASAHFLSLSAGTIGALTLLTRSPFMVFFIGLLTVAGAVTLWIELLIREAAVYVIVLMLPLAFAAFVWPARRVWALRAVEILVALILSKFAIVAVLALGGAAMSNGHAVTGMIAGVVLLAMAVCAPWALLRLVPLAEVASTAAGSLRQEARPPVDAAWAVGERAERWAEAASAMRWASDRDLATSGASSGSPSAEDGQTRRNGTENAFPGQDDLEPAPGSVEDGATGESPGADPPAQATERIPGMDEMWQQPDGSWDPLILGPEGVAGQPLWPPADAGAPAAPGSDRSGATGSEPDGRGGAAKDAGADDAELTPDQQPPQDGVL